MLTGTIIGAAIFGGASLMFVAATIPSRNAWAQALGILIGVALTGAGLGAMFSLVETEQYPKGMVRVYSDKNAAGASGCVPHDTLKEITR